jgi:hypothetical protein
MKKTIILVVSLFFVVFSGFSQKFTGGVFFSPSLTWMKPDLSKRVENAGVKMGFNFGLQGDMNIVGENFRLNFGLMANKLNGKITYLDSIPTFKTNDSIYSFKNGATVTYKLTYISLPIGLKGRTNEIGYMTYFMKAGIQPYILWKSKADVTQGNISNEPINDEVRFMYFDYYLGGGFEYNLGGSTSLVVEIVFNNGFSDLTRTRRYYNNKLQDTDKIILNHLDLRIGIIF